MTKTFIDVLEELEKTTGTNDKIEILRVNADVPHLKDYLDYATNPKITFGIAILEPINYKCDIYRTLDYSWSQFKSVLDKLASRELTGNEAKSSITSELAMTTTPEEKWYRKCLLKDLASIGLGLRLLEKGFGETKKFRLMLANPEDELHKTPDEKGVLDKKANGVRTLAEVEEGTLTAIYGGRNGLIAENFYFIKEQLESLFEHVQESFTLSWVLDGEVHVNDVLEDTMSLYGFKYRTKDEFIGAKGKLKEKAWADYQADEARINAFKASAKFTIFDIVPLDNWKAQSYDADLVERKKNLDYLKSVIKTWNLDKLEVIESEEVSGHDEAIKAAQRWIAKGFEGGIYKPYSGVYEWKRSKNWVKIKEVVDFEIEFDNYVIQKDKYNPDGSKKPAMVGKVIGHDADGNIYEVGTGKALDEKTRQDMLENWETKYKGKIGTCTAQRPSGKGKYICPRLDIIRLDRSSLTD